MGVYVNGMEMPHDCDECRLCAFIPVGDYGIHRKCLPLNANAEITIRRTDCPLVPVPPHGRLIDADAFKKYISVAFEEVAPELSGGYSWLAKQITEDLIKDIDDAPTVIPAEEGE